LVAYVLGSLDVEDIVELFQRNVIQALRVVRTKRGTCGLGDEEEYEDQRQDVETGEDT
jgi:hypothetical protein